MGKLILIRHGQTEMNAQNLYFGKLNPPLNDLGIEQAYMAKEKLSNIAYDCIYSSPLERTKETAEICNYLDKEIIYDSRLEEINFGIFEGLTFKEISEYTKDNLIISHWGIINCIISYFVSGTLDTYWKFKVDNCSIVIFEGDFNFSYLTKLY